jgi:hypothetical protein
MKHKKERKISLNYILVIPKKKSNHSNYYAFKSHTPNDTPILIVVCFLLLSSIGIDLLTLKYSNTKDTPILFATTLSPSISCVLQFHFRKFEPQRHFWIGSSKDNSFHHLYIFSHVFQFYQNTFICYLSTKYPKNSIQYHDNIRYLNSGR